MNCSSDPKLLWLWCRPAPTNVIRLLAWALPHGADSVLKKKKRQKTKKCFTFYILEQRYGEIAYKCKLSNVIFRYFVAMILYSNCPRCLIQGCFDYLAK